MYQPHYLPDASALVFIDGTPEAGKDYLGGRTNVFVCGALQHPPKMTALTGRAVPFSPAVCQGYRRTTERVGDREIPFMVPDPDDTRRVLTGVVWLDLSDAEVRAVEALELEGNLRQPVLVELIVGERRLRAITYIRRQLDGP